MSPHAGVRRSLSWAAGAVAAGTALAACQPISLSAAGGDSTGPSAATAAIAPGLVTAPEQGYQPIYDFITSAHHTLDMTMYELVDTTAEQDLVRDAERGVRVRVVLDHHLEKKNNQAAFRHLTEHGVHVAWANTHYASTHQKTITVDDSTSAIMTGNLTSRYYSTTRDLGVMDNTPADVTAIEQTFDADFAGMVATPPNGADLMWSPTTAEPDMISLINSARQSLQVENEEMGLSAVESALIAAAHRGVDVRVTMTRSSDWTDASDKLVRGGVHVATYSSSASLYIHAKVIVRDAGQPDAKAFVGSENFSSASLTRNRELGLTLTAPAILTALHDTLGHDYFAAAQWTA
jgi:phosphatidylserine/phosphatidylglycerophosphate/cardiolipin synthase-like enzyme